MQRWDCSVSTIYTSQTQTFKGISKDFFSQNYYFFSLSLFVVIYLAVVLGLLKLFLVWHSVVMAAFFPLAASLHCKALLAHIDSLTSFHFSFPVFWCLSYAAVSDCFHHSLLLQMCHHCSLLSMLFRKTKQQWRKSHGVFFFPSLFAVR